MNADQSARSHLHDLIDQLPAEDVMSVLAQVEARVQGAQRPEPGPNAWAWIGMGPAINGRTDNADHLDEALADGFGRW